MMVEEGLTYLSCAIVHTAKVAKASAMLATFFFSALLHEILFGVAFGVIRPWFFIAMLGKSLPLLPHHCLIIYSNIPVTSLLCAVFSFFPPFKQTLTLVLSSPSCCSAQVPLMFINRFVVTRLTPKNRARWGNILVWNSLFIGQPLIELLYCREYFQDNDDFFCNTPVALSTLP
jgi:hypothetical protein